jgi:hypothetical protein
MGTEENKSRDWRKSIEVRRPLQAAGNETETWKLQFEKGTEWGV